MCLKECRSHTAMKKEYELRYLEKVLCERYNGVMKVTATDEKKNRVTVIMITWLDGYGTLEKNECEVTELSFEMLFICNNVICLTKRQYTLMRRPTVWI